MNEIKIATKENDNQPQSDNNKNNHSYQPQNKQFFQDKVEEITLTTEEETEDVTREDEDIEEIEQPEKDNIITIKTSTATHYL